MTLTTQDDKTPESVKQNEDYQLVLKTYNALKAQQGRAKNDIRLLKEQKERALENPIDFISKLFNEKSIYLPQRQHIAQVPTINLSKYKKGNANSQSESKDSLESDLIEFIEPTDNTETESMDAGEQLDDTPPSSPSSPLLSLKIEAVDKPVTAVLPKVGDVVRGRLFTERKPPSFNRLWGEQEQRRLENLLIEYPDEEVSAHRWAKIARALGNRTPKQVASRTQKYFIKLQKMGIPVPGKPPSMTGYLNKINNITAPPKKKQKTGDHEDSDDDIISHTKRVEYYVPPPVLMMDNRRLFKPRTDLPQELSNLSSTVHNTPEYQELLALLKSGDAESNRNERVVPRDNVSHAGYRCDGCDMDPIMGARWHCKECHEFDLCSCCHDSKFEAQSHKHTHQMSCVSQVESLPYYLDNDYKFSHEFGESNYLDPNSKM